MKVYLVSSGSYSDYRIDAVFDTEEKAKEYIELYDGEAIEEYDLNPEFKGKYKEGYKPFEIWYEVKSNSFRCSERKWGWADRTDLNHCKPCNSGTGWWIHLIAKDENHALKIANERIMQMKAINLVGKDRAYYNLYHGLK